MKFKIATFFLYFFLLCVFSLRTTPFKACEYGKVIGFGFDTDIFKNSPPLRNYHNPNNQIMSDLKTKGVGHLRLRSRADIFGFSTSTYDAVSMKEYLDGLEIVVKDMIQGGLFPIISWIHHDAEERASFADEENYVKWWSLVAQRLVNTTYELAFNLFTEIDDGPLRDYTTYNRWTKRAISAIIQTGGYNTQRIIILGAPGKTAKSLWNIAPEVYNGKTNFLAEWHLYASGPNKDGGQKNWVGNGSTSDKLNVDSVMNEAMSFTLKTGVKTWIGAWMPYDNIGGSQNQTETEAFACYFATAASKRKINWAMNKLENFYDTEMNKWILKEEIGRYENKLILEIPRILNAALCSNAP